MSPVNATVIGFGGGGGVGEGVGEGGRLTLGDVPGPAAPFVPPPLEHPAIIAAVSRHPANAPERNERGREWRFVSRRTPLILPGAAGNRAFGSRRFNVEADLIRPRLREMTRALAVVAGALGVVLAAGCASPGLHRPSAARLPVSASAEPSAPPSQALPPPAQPSHEVASPAATPSARPVVSHLQRLIIAGDSIPEDLGPMVTTALAGPGFSGHTESHPSTGLVRDDFYDWPAAARRIAAEHPTTVILLLGGNDDQPIKPPGAPYALPATPRWVAEYTRRAGLVLDALRRGGVRQVSGSPCRPLPAPA